ncbi:hypothetical protein MIB92_00385 [Aestuariirhabdus sp. Z084]|uniref:hypothetical protein n=1 Tax=Aestuariirhabdus haliotis TaxID=2918751 RepID=UPI00201B36AB|nr:hypothetical protein [Aestuariirhabdus haliotis]MCL6414093.1 hypothetical protein [Aestuariirhabdus haliotis]MCL6418025.1 hypothetical protein [Aestuariirhabdus haliotis]
MKCPQFKFALVATAVALLPTSVMADQTYVCSQAGMERIISVVYQNPESPVPCEVVYQKGDEVQSLWSAENEQGYCEHNAEQLVERQRGWGWDCAMAGSGNESQPVTQ